ncbi:MAG: oxidoreductase [Blastococcus sp.]|nr:oxidoreductase [Blastococcus sp.]
MDLLPEWEPGAHIDLILGPDVERQYSLCGAPSDRTSWRIAVRKDPASRGGSLAIHSTVRPGHLLTVRGPRNHFQLAEAPSYVFIAGGIGITPILPMVAKVAQVGKDWRLVYGGRHEGSMAFTDELKAYGDRVTLVPQDVCGPLNLSAVLRDRAEDAAIYGCGPEPMLTALEQIAAEWPPEVLHLERFKPRQVSPETENQPFEVVLARSKLKLTVRADQSVLEALEDAEVDMLFSCREGTCGTCETTVVAGQPDHRDSILSDRDRRTGNTMMICVSRSHSPELVLDI